jgi:hypothetical protein
MQWTLTAAIRRGLTERLQYIAASRHLDLTGTVGKYALQAEVIPLPAPNRDGRNTQGSISTYALAVPTFTEVTRVIENDTLLTYAW